MSCGQRTLLSESTSRAAVPPSPTMPGHTLLSVTRFPFDLFLSVHPFIYFLLLPCADGGKRDISVEKNGNKCGGGREENGKEHGQHAGNLHCLPHRDTVDDSAFCCLTARHRRCCDHGSMRSSFYIIIPVFRPAESVPEGGTPATPDTLWRRYSEFELLRTYLLVTYPYIIVPPLPEKRVRIYGRENTRTFQLQKILVVDMIGIFLRPSASVAA